MPKDEIYLSCFHIAKRDGKRISPPSVGQPADLCLAFLRQFLPYEHGAPSRATFYRLVAMVRPAAFAEVVARLVAPLDAGGGAVAFDGKAVRGATGLMVLHAYASETGLTLAAREIPDKTNEIPVLRDMLALALALALALVDVKDRIVTADALHTQRETAAAIAKAGGRSVMPLKNNQKALNDDVALFLSDPAVPGDVDMVVDAGHGRVETRAARVSTDIAFLSHHAWPGRKAIGRVDRVRIDKATGKSNCETQFYLIGHLLDAAQLNAAARSHWAVENGLHWVLDVSFGEDASRSDKIAARNLATPCRIALNALRSIPTAKKMTIPQRLLTNMLNPENLSSILEKIGVKYS